MTDKTKIKDYTIQRNQTNLSQAQGATYIISHMLILLGEDSFTPFEEHILKVISDLDVLLLSKNTKTVLPKLE